MIEHPDDLVEGEVYYALFNGQPVCGRFVKMTVDQKCRLVLVIERAKEPAGPGNGWVIVRGKKIKVPWCYLEDVRCVSAQ